MKKKQVAELRQSKQERIKFDVLLTSHEMAGLDQGVLKSINWECLVIPLVTCSSSRSLLTVDASVSQIRTISSPFHVFEMPRTASR